MFEAMGCYYHFCSCQESRPSLTDQDIERGNKKREMDDMRRDYIKEKGYKNEEMRECDWWESFKTNDKLENHVGTHFSFRRSLSTDSLLTNKKDGSLFGYVQCNLIVPDEIKICQLSSNFQKYRGWKKRYWKLHEELCNRERNVRNSSENADIQFQARKWNSYNSCSTFIRNLACNAPKFTVLFSILHKNGSIISFNQ